MKITFHIFCILIFCLSINGYGFLPESQKVRIIYINDTNQFQIQDSTAISLANIRTYSIYDPDSLKRKFASKAYRNTTRHLLDHQFQMETTGLSDSVAQVHLFRNILFIKQSLNERFLQLGFGFFNPEPESKYTKQYRRASNEAKRKNLGVYDKKQFTTIPPFKYNALWCNLGIGTGMTWEKRFGKIDNGGAFFCNLSLHTRLNGTVLSFGYEGIYLNECNTQSGYFLTAGLSHYGRWQDLICSTGISINRAAYQDDMSDYSWISDPFLGLPLKFQMLFHFPAGLGAGFSLDMNINKHASYLIVTFNVSLGVWIL